MRRPRKTIRRILYVLATFVVLLLILFGWLAGISRVKAPPVNDPGSLQLTREEPDRGLYTIGNSWFRKSNSGLYELYVEGQPYERGVINGKLTKELVQRQEDHFSEQINKMIPSTFYRHFLKYFIGWFNRDLSDNVREEYKEEIYGISASASDKYDYIGTNYQRLLNYHAAHDIGHALQNMALVGCTSFGTWGDAADSNMIIGRNFDFYVGDKFAEDKILSFVNPSEGYKFMTITWGGFIGAVSGMNEKGLTVTINADKSDLPSASATPVSLVAREILQYAKNSTEAIAMARSRKMFVSESFLVGSATENKAIVIEKTPRQLDIYDPHKKFIVCANHFQGNTLAQSASNRQQMEESASLYRYKRVMELLDTTGHNSLEKTVALLRDRRGLQNKDIGLGNEKAVNQLIAHHSVVFEPRKLLVWVSTSPWQLGPYVAYDLHKVFSLAGMKENREICETGLTVPADSFLQTSEYAGFLRYRAYKQRLAEGENISADSLIASNPQYYHAYVLAGNYMYKNRQFEEALGYYQQALTKTVATKKEENDIKTKIAQCKKKVSR